MCTFSEFSFVNSSFKSSENVLTSIINSSTRSVCCQLSSVSMCEGLYSLMRGVLPTLLQVIRYPLLSWSVLQKQMIRRHRNSLQSKPEISSNSEKKDLSSRKLLLNLHCKNISVQHIVSCLWSYFHSLHRKSFQWKFTLRTICFFLNSKSANINLKS